MSPRYGGWDGFDGWYPPAPPKQPPPEQGIKVKKIGGTWWGQRWIAALEQLSAGYSARLTRGRTYARAGRVHDLTVEHGTVRARVTGSDPTPYRVTIRVAELGKPIWSKAIDAMAKEAIFSAQLLSGEMPKEIDEAFRAAGASLFPTVQKDLTTECSCPDWANPCKHIAAAHYVLGEAFDKDPFLLFELRGRSRDEVLDALRRARAGTKRAQAKAAGAAETAGAADEGAIPGVVLDSTALEGFERFRAPIPALRLRIEAPAAPGLVLRQLGAPHSWSIRESVLDLLGPVYEAAGVLARELALAPQGEQGSEQERDEARKQERQRNRKRERDSDRR